MIGSHIENILRSGANIIIRPIGWNGLRDFGVCIEHRGLRNGIVCMNGLEDGLRRAHEWVQEVDFYQGIQWTAEDCKAMEARVA